MRNDAELKELSIDELEKIMEDTNKLGYPEGMKVGQELIVPVFAPENSKEVFYGALDFTGNSNKLSEEEWRTFTKEVTGFEPIGKMILKKTNKKDAMYIFAMADSSIGACNIITVFSSIWDLIEEVLSWNMIDDEKIVDNFEKVLDEKDLNKALELCEEYFTHSFFTGLVWGAFEYISGWKPDKQGYAERV